MCRISSLSTAFGVYYSAWADGSDYINATFGRLIETWLIESGLQTDVMGIIWEGMGLIELQMGISSILCVASLALSATALLLTEISRHL
ncbi:hypothetical protein ACHWQZ_G019682 [Mnemiopsis leidyi]